MPAKDPSPANNIVPASAADELRRRAESVARERALSSAAPLAGSSLEEVEKIMHELQVHQIELELQNEELRRTQAEVGAGHARYFDLYELAPVGYVTLSESGLIRQVNLSAASLLGVARSALAAQPIGNFILPTDQDIFFHVCKRLLASGEPEICELRLLRNSMAPTWVQFSAALAQDAEGTPEIRLALNDISAFKQAETALYDSLEFSHNLISSMQDGFSVIDPNGTIMESNLALCRMTGFAREELVGAGVPHPYWPPEEYERLYAALDYTMKGGVRIFELTFMRRNGERFPAIVSPFAVENKDGIISYAATVRDVTERKRADGERVAERQLLSTLVNLLPTWIFVKDRDSRFVLANRACAINMGAASPKELIGKTDADFYPPEIAEQLRVEEEGVLQGVPVVNKEVCKENAAGEPRILLINKVPLDNGNEGITGVVGAAFDVTEIKQAEQALRASTAFQRSILDSLPAHVVVLDEQGKILAVNEPWLRFARENGNPAEDKVGVGANYLEVCCPAIHGAGDPYAQAAVAGVQAVLSGEKTRFSLEYPCNAPEHPRWFAMEVVRPTENIGGAIVTHTDLTERKQAEEALRLATQKLKLHVEQTPIGVIEWDLDFRVSRWNPAAEAIFGYRSEEAIGQPASFILPEAFREDVEKVIQSLMDRTGGERSSNPNLRKDGTRIECEWYNTPLIDEQGSFTGAASLVMDVTAKTHALQLLAWEKSALESIVSTDSLAEVLDGLMLGLDEQLPGAMCSVLLMDDDGIHLRHGGAPNLPKAFSRAIDGLAIGPAEGSCGTAAYLNQQVIVTDIGSDPLWAAYRETALRYGLHACWSVPIQGGQGKILGTFAIYCRKSRCPASPELELIDRAARVMRIAIERKQAEENIRQLNAGLEQRVQARTAELQAANASLGDFKHALDEHAIVAITTPDGTITYANDRFCEISKYPQEELLGRTHSLINSGYHSKEFFHDLWATIRSGRTWKGEVRNRAKDGSIYWENSTIVPFLGPEGKPQQYIAIRTDITERKQMEEALHESEERVRLATEAAGIAVWEWDLRTSELKWDAQMFEIYGLPPSPGGRAHYSEWISAVLPAELPNQLARLQHTIATCGRDQREFRITRASDHAVRNIRASELVITGADGKAARLVGINFDTTESKLAEEQIRELNAVLESRATALETANKELEAFSYSVSHDLRAPLRAVDGFSRMVLADYATKLDDEGHRMLDVIRSEAQRMGRLIDDLLAFSRLGRQPIESVQIGMRTLAQEIFDELSALEPNRHIQLELHPLPPGFGTQAMIRQVWVNLIGNAIKFTKDREVAVVEIGANEGEGGETVYYIKDNGVGFEMRFVDKLFGVFQRLHTEQEFPGTGVGLALVQRIILRHGGRVWAEAEVNHGATFYFTLPNQKS